MRNALWQLGLHDCYHMHTLIENPERDASQWVRALEAKYAGKGSFTRDDWDRLLGQCQAVCDIPPAFFGAELAQLYPEAKVIILNRDPEKWYDSVLNSIYAMIKPKSPFVVLQRIFCLLFDSKTRSMFQYTTALTKYAMPYDHGKEKEKALAWYKNQYQEFYDNIPEDRRIDYAVGDGWKPLCDFLDVPVPMVKDQVTGEMVEAPFPRLNDRGSFHANTSAMWSKGRQRAIDNFFGLVGRTAMIGIVGYAGYFAVNRLPSQLS
jgi:hypothetical protein